MLYNVYNINAMEKAMGMRAVRLDEEAEKTLERLKKRTGLSISEILKRGLGAFEQQHAAEAKPRAYEIYARYELGEGGWSIAPAENAKQAFREAIRKKHKR